jgi:hypothetical protein
VLEAATASRSQRTREAVSDANLLLPH